MIFSELAIKGAFYIFPEPFKDARGVFRRHFCKHEFAAHGLNSRLAQANVSENPAKYTLRGFHYQDSPRQEAKTLSCFSGTARIVIADIRKQSETYLKWLAITIDPSSGSVHVPEGCAVAFMTLRDNTVLHYYVSHAYSPELYRGIRYNDPAIGVEWPVEPSVISDRDRNFPDFKP